VSLPVEGDKAALIGWEGVLPGSVGLEGAVIGQEGVLPVECTKTALIEWEGALPGSVGLEGAEAAFSGLEGIQIPGSTGWESVRVGSMFLETRDTCRMRRGYDKSSWCVWWLYGAAYGVAGSRCARAYIHMKSHMT